MKRLFKSFTGRQSPSPRKATSPRKARSSRPRHSSRRADVRDHGQQQQGAELPELVPLTFLGYQYLPDGSFQPVYAAVQAAAYNATYGTTSEDHHDHAEASHGNLVGPQHFCYKCGKARSKRYHMDNPIRLGNKAPASCCNKCRKKTPGSDPGSKYLQHFCVECGRVRSKSYHQEHPVRAGQTPRPSYCLKCRTKNRQTAPEREWEDVDAGETTIALPRLKIPTGNHCVATEQGPVLASESEEDAESDDYVKPRQDRKSSKNSSRLSVPASSHRHASKESIRSTRSFQASVEDAPPTPPETPAPVVKKTQSVEKKQHAEKKVASETHEQDVPAASTTGSAAAVDTTLAVSQASGNPTNHLHVVYVEVPCHHHGCDGHNHSSSHNASRSRVTRGCRSDSNTTTTTSSKQSRQVAFATPEVASRHEADADYDRTAVPENHDEPFTFGLNGGGSRGDNYNARGLSPDGPPRREPTPGPLPRGFDSSSGGGPSSSSGYASTTYSEYDEARMDSHSPPPQYTTAPPKVFTPEEIRRLWEDPQPVNHRQPRQEAERRSSNNTGPAPARDFSAMNRENFAANQRSASEGTYPPGFGNGLRPPTSDYGNGRPSNLGSPDHRPSDSRRASDGRYRNDENIDPKTRYNTSRRNQSENRGGSSRQSPNMYNNTNQNNEYNNNTRQNQSRGPRSSENANPNMYTNNSQTNTSNNENSRSSQSRSSSRQTENNPPNLYNNQSSNNYPRTRPSQSSSQSSERRRDENTQPVRENKRGTGRQASTSTSPGEVPFTARERMWTDGPEEARKMREAMERLERAAAAASTAETPASPPTPDIRVNDSPIPESGDTNGNPPTSTPDFASTMPDLGSHSRDRAFTPDTTRRNFSTATFDSNKPDFGSSDSRNFTSSSSRTTRNFTPATFASHRPEFGSPDSRNFTSSTRGGGRDFDSSSDFGSDKRNFSGTDHRRDFSPNVPDDFVPPRPSGWASSSSPPPFGGGYRTTSSATWEHPCGPVCNEFCPDREDHVDREIVEIDSDEEEEILGVKVRNGKATGSRKSSTKKSRASAETTLRKASSDAAFRLALVRLRRHSFAADSGVPSSPAKSVGSSYYTASETSCC